MTFALTLMLLALAEAVYIRVVRKQPYDFADAILSFGATPTEPLVDPAAEAARIKAAEDANKDVVGVGKVVIQPKHTSKLPGL